MDQLRRLVPKVEDQKCRRPTDGPAGPEVLRGSAMALGEAVAIERSGTHSDHSTCNGRLDVARRLNRHDVKRKLVEMSVSQLRIGAEVPDIEISNATTGLPMGEIG